MPGETYAFSMLSSDYNDLRSRVIALNNFSQYNHCYVVQLFSLTSLIKAFTTIISNRSFVLALGFQAKCLKFTKMRATQFLSFSYSNDFFYDCKC